MLNEAIHKYIKDNISPKDLEKTSVSNKYNELTKMLKGANFQSGSFARFTAVTPVNDLDIIWELPGDILSKKFSTSQIVTKTINPVDLNVSNILSELAQELRKEYAKNGTSIMKIEPRSHSVGIFFGPTEDDFSIDVVPAVPSGTNEYGNTTYWVPEIAEMSRTHRKSFYAGNSKIIWIKSDPRGYIKEATELNDKNLNYRHVVKFCKKWKWAVKRAYPEIKFKSFHIEMITKDLFLKNAEMNTVDGIKLFFSEIKNYLATPRIKDRANNGKFIDDYVSSELQESKNKIVNEGFKVVRTLDNLSAEPNQSVTVQKIGQIFIISASGQSFGSNVAAPVSRPYATDYDSK